MNAEIYTALPIEVEQDQEQDHINTILQSSVNKEKRSDSGSHLRVRVILHLLKLTVLSMVVFFSLPYMHTFRQYSEGKSAAGESKSDVVSGVSPTLLPGGGRDWIIDTTHKIITSKHNPNLALGSLRHDPLILTNRYETGIDKDDSSAPVKFAKTELEALRKGERVPMRSMLLALQFPHHVDTFSHWDYMLAGTHGDDANSGADDNGNDKDDEEWNLEYIDENFLVLNGEFALDVSFWNMETGNTVNFVKVSENTKWRWWEWWLKQKTLTKGGGRDWVLNEEDGTISPKGYPYLALGRGTRSLALMDIHNNMDSVWKFDRDELEQLKRGAIMALADKKSNAGAMKKEENEQYFQEWRYIESKVNSDREHSVLVKYIDDNYLAISEEGVDEEKALVLDVALWLMTPYNSVNFVGGWTYRT
eukprot:812282_1